VARRTLALACGVAASFGFALPVATPPNAIAYGSGSVTRGQMLRAGSVLDVLMGVAATLLVVVLAPLLGG
jgi:sodium-dependent dicarboxylate transporter 2/3/5